MLRPGALLEIFFNVSHNSSMPNKNCTLLFLTGEDKIARFDSRRYSILTKNQVIFKSFSTLSMMIFFNGKFKQFCKRKKALLYLHMANHANARQTRSLTTVPLILNTVQCRMGLPDFNFLTPPISTEILMRELFSRIIYPSQLGGGGVGVCHRECLISLVLLGSGVE
jgi:hypothetical protein